MGSRGGSGAAWRGPTALAALVLLGVAGGYGASSALSLGPAGSGTAEPVVARGPSNPTARPPARTPAAQEPDDPALQRGITLTETTMGSGRFAITFPVPVGWTTNENATNEAKWKQPGTPNNTYVMRVELILDEDLTIKEAKEQRLEELRSEQDRPVVLSERRGFLEYTYVSDEGTDRHSFIQWIDVSGSGKAEVEVVVHGRERDVPGTRDLIARVAEGMRAAKGPSS